MREIKFRAWDTRFGTFLDDVAKGESDSLNEIFLNNENGRIIFQQFTGLKDKNGVEIYEGDIVTTDYPTVKNMADNWVVEYGNTGMYQMAVGSFKQSIHDLVYNDWKLEVIGNIYSNPELLEDK